MRNLLQPPVSVRQEEQIAHLSFAAEGKFADGEDQLAGGFDRLEVGGDHAANPGVVNSAFENDDGVLTAQQAPKEPASEIRRPGKDLSFNPIKMTPTRFELVSRP